MDAQDEQDLELTLAKIAESRKEREGKNHRGHREAPKGANEELGKGEGLTTKSAKGAKAGREETTDFTDGHG